MALLILCSADTQPGTLGRGLSNNLLCFLKTKYSEVFLIMNHTIHKFEGCFLRGQLSSTVA